ncbi:MAG: host specificity factor TipJ family phage tail protein [Pseudomonadota bacterium]|nr:host specificity factor TipJ family phage tail protein [Pseudomonadota bacterium]
MSIEVQVRAHPLVGEARLTTVPAGLTLEGVVAQVSPQLKHAQIVLVRDGHAWPVKPEHFASVRPTPGTTVIVQPKVGAEALFGLAVTWLTGLGLSAATATLVVAGAAVVLSVGTYLLTRAFMGADADPSGRTADKENPILRGLQNVYPTMGTPVPMVLGRHRMAAVKTASGYTQYVGQKTYRIERMTFGVGPVALDELKIGTTEISKFKDVQLQFRNVDQAETLARIPALADMDVDWLDDDDAMTLYSRDVFEDPESAKLDYNVRVTRTTPENTISATVRFYFAGLVLLDDQNEKQPRWRQIGIYYRPASGGAWTTVNEFWYKGKTTAILRFGRTIRFPYAGEWDVSIIRLSEDDEETNVQDDSYLEALQSVQPGTLPSPSGVAEITMRIKATDQINGALDPVNAVVEQMAPVWNGASFSDPVPVRHPADIYVNLLRSAIRRRPVPNSKIDLDGVRAWKQAWPDWRCDMVVTQDLQLGDLCKQVLATGLAMPIHREGKYGVLTDRGAEPAVQIFNMRNTSDMQATWTPAPDVHGLKLAFTSEKAGWETDEVTIYANGYSAANATKLEPIEFPGLVRGETESVGRIAKLGYYHLAQMKLRTTEVSFTTELDHLVCGRGDPVIFTTPVLRNQVGMGRVAAVTRASGEIGTLTLDDTLPGVPDGYDAFVVLRGSNGALQYLRGIKAGRDFTIEAGSGIALDGGAFDGDLIARGDLATVYPAETEAAKWLVKDIAPDYGERARLTLVEATEVPLDDLSRPLPEYDPKVISINEAMNLTSSIEFSGGQLFIVVRWEALDYGQTRSYRAVVEDGEGDPVLTWFGSDTAVRVPVEEVISDTYTVTVAAEQPDGRWGPLKSIQVNTAPHFTAPDTVDGFVSQVAAGQIHLAWSKGNSVVDYYELRYSPATSGATWASSVPLLPKFFGTRTSVPARNGTYLVKAVTGAGTQSTAASTVVITSAGTLPNAIETLTLAPTFYGNFDPGLSVIENELLFASDVDLLEIDDLLEEDNLVTYYREATRAVFTADEVIDLGAVDTAQVSAEISVLAYYSGFDILLIDDLTLTPDLLGAADGSWSLTPQISVTDDDPSGSPSWSDWQDLVVGEYRARGYRFRLVFEASDPQILVAVSSCDFIVDMPDRVEKGADVDCPIGGVTVTFATPFRVAPSLVIDGQGLPTGARSIRTAVTASSFHQKFVDSGGSDIAASFDWHAIGYGQQ